MHHGIIETLDHISTNSQVHFNLEKQCRYPTPRLSVSLITSSLLLISVGLYLMVIPLTLELHWYSLDAASNSLNHVVNPTAPLVH
jgi:hypothetical protein